MEGKKMKKIAIILVLISSSWIIFAETQAELWNSFTQNEKILFVIGFIGGTQAAQETTLVVRDGGYEGDAKTIELTNYFLKVIESTILNNQSFFYWTAMMDAAYLRKEFENTGLGYVFMTIVMEEASRNTTQ
jgi:hypothetical protein